MRTKGPSVERQLQIAKERGLTIRSKGDKPVVVRKPMIAPPPFMDAKKDNELIPEAQVEASCQKCEALKLLTGRHKVEDGWCIDGVFWPNSAIGVIRHIKLIKGEDAAKKFASALSVLSEELHIDMDNLKASYVR